MYKSAVKTYLIALIVTLIILPTIIFISDPYMVFHNRWIHQNKMIDNMRIQNYGLIKYGKFDGIIIGTSMLQNTSANEASEKLGNVRFANLSISGGSFYERFRILDMALKTRHFKHVIMSFDYKFNKLNEVNKTFYPDLYSDNPIKGKIAVYSTDKALICTLLDLKCDFTDFDLDRPKAWFKIDEQSRRFGGFQNWLKYAQEDYHIKGAFNYLKSDKKHYSAENIWYKQIIDQEILPLFEHTDTEFSVIIPPYGALWWGKHKDSLDELFKPYQYLAEKADKFPNVKIYWFYDEKYIFDIAKYKDLTHYHPSLNSLQLDAIKNGTNIFNTKNCQEKFADFAAKIRNFDIDQYIRQIP